MRYGLHYDITKYALVNNFAKASKEYSMSINRIATIVYNTMDSICGWKKGTARNYGALRFRYNSVDFYYKVHYKQVVEETKTLIEILKKLLPTNGEWVGTYKELHDYGKKQFTEKEIPTCFWPNHPTSMIYRIEEAKEEINTAGIFTSVNKHIKYGANVPITISTVDPTLEIREANKRLIYDTTICDRNIDIRVMLGILKKEDVYDIAKIYGLSSDDVHNVIYCVIAQEMGVSTIQVMEKTCQGYSQLLASGWIEKTIMSLITKGRRVNGNKTD